MMQVNLSALPGDPEHPADLPVSPARGNERGHLPLPPGERHRPGAGPGQLARRPVNSHAELQHLLRVAASPAGIRVARPLRPGLAGGASYSE
jgi:hypothetical protein